jgi:hypothetical protein
MTARVDKAIRKPGSSLSVTTAILHMIRTFHCSIHSTPQFEGKLLRNSVRCFQMGRLALWSPGSWQKEGQLLCLEVSRVGFLQSVPKYDCILMDPRKLTRHDKFEDQKGIGSPLLGR